MPQTILIVDDSPALIALADAVLRDKYRIRVANNGEKALTMLAHDAPVDLILLDVLMPGIDGFEVCRRLKASAEWCDIPIIFLTAMSDNGDEAYGLSLGAVDYIAKPVEPLTLQARVSTHLELRRIRQELQQKNDLLCAEREIIEGMILRMRNDPAFDERHLRRIMQPVERTSGDICLAAFCPDGRQLALLGDFTGHGLTAAIGGGAVKQSFYGLCANDASLGEIIAELNQLLCANLLSTQFMTATLVEVSANRQQLRLWGGGMHEALHAGPGGSITEIPLSGLPLGVMPGTDFSADIHCLTPAPGDRVLLYSDGVIEARDPQGNMYDTHRLKAAYQRLLNAQGPLNDVINDIEQFVAGEQQQDDMVLMELSL
jgi:two-component system, HptB-dependent secretion and biofilm response regulator